MKKLFLIDSKATLDHFQASARDEFDSGQKIATSQRGALACLKAGVQYDAIDSLVSGEATVRFGERYFNDVHYFCTVSDERLAQEFPEVLKYGIRPFQYYYYELKLLLDPVMIRAQQWTSYLDANEIRSIFYRRTNVQSRNFQGDIVELLAKARSIELIPADISFETVAAKRPSLSRKWFFDLKTNLKAIAREWVYRKKSKYLLFSVGHDIPYIVPELKVHNLYPESLEKLKQSVSINPSAFFESFAQTILNSGSFKSISCYQGVDYAPLFYDPIYHFIAKRIPAGIQLFHITSNYLNRVRMDRRFALTGSVFHSYEDRMQMLACQKHGLKLITIQEGGGYGSFETLIYDYTEAIDGDVMLCYGEGNVEYYQEKKIPAKLFLPVGSPCQDAYAFACTEKNSPFVGDRVRSILYIGTSVEDDYNYFPNNAGTGTSYFERQREIFEMFAKLPEDVQVFVKIHPLDFGGRELLEFEKFKRFQKVNGSLESCLKDIDLYVLDYPSSALMSCSLTNAYVFMLIELGFAGLSKSNQKYYSTRMYCFSQRAELFQSLERITRSNAEFPPKNSREYLKKYVTHLDDGKSKERAVQYLLNLRKS